MVDIRRRVITVYTFNNALYSIYLSSLLLFIIIITRLDLDEYAIGPKTVQDVTEHRICTPLKSNGKAVLRWIAARKVRMCSEIIPSIDETEEGPPPLDANAIAASRIQLLREELPVPSFREKCICPYEIRRFFLAQRGRALMALVSCNANCGEFVRKIDIRFHRRFLCSKRRIKCRFSDYCDMSYFFCDQENHEKNECDRLIKLNSLLDTVEIKNTLIACEQCGDKVRSRDMTEHMALDCPFRLVHCEQEDCDVRVQANLMNNHLKFSCQSKMLRRTSLLISRARKRLNYPRPWGIIVSTNVEDDVDDNIMAVASKESNDGISRIILPPPDTVVLLGDNIIDDKISKLESSNNNPIENMQNIGAI